MCVHHNLQNAREQKKDEFYTSYEDIQKELNYYEGAFVGKTVLCNCDDPFESNFCKFFLKNFNYLKLKRLICTSFYSSPVIEQQLSIFDMLEEQKDSERGYIMDISEVPMANGRGVTDSDIEKLLKSKKNGVKKLQGDGDFRSDECLRYLDECDIVVTNPPFSKFREFVSTILEHKKDFIIIGSLNAITYREFFPLLRDNKVWIGASIHSGDREFRVPDDYPLTAAGCRIDEFGNKYIRVKGVRWYSTVDYEQRHEELILYKHYNAQDYPKYENYDAINVNVTSEIPVDYPGVMGVPITFLDKYNPDQFDIIGLGISNSGIEIGVKPYKPEHKKYRKEVQKRGAVDGDLYMMIDGVVTVPYARVLIKRKV